MNINVIFYRASIRNISDYSPFGVQLSERTISGDGYRYSFQSQESDNEVYGDGNYINYKYRGYNPRLGRFFQVDPIAHEYPFNSPYAFSENNVIHARELEGLEMVTVYNSTPNTKKPEVSHSYEIKGLTENVNLVLLWDGQGNVTGSYAKTYGKEGFKISDNADRISNKDIKSTFNGITPKQTQEQSPPPSESKSYQAEQANKAYNKGDLGGYLEWKLKDMEQGLQGEKGLKNYSTALTYTGIAVGATISAPIGIALTIGSDLIDTGLDYKNQDATTATKNLGFRVGLNLVGFGIGKSLKNVGGKADVELGTGVVLEGLEENATGQGQ